MEIRISVQFSLVLDENNIIYHELKDKVFNHHDVESCILRLFKDHKNNYYPSIENGNKIDIEKSGVMITVIDAISDSYNEYIYEYTDVDEYLSDKSILRKDPFFSEYINNGKYLSLVKMINEGIKEIKISYDLDGCGYFNFNLVQGVNCLAKEILNYEQLMSNSFKIGMFKEVTLQVVTVNDQRYESKLDQNEYKKVCDMFNDSAEEQLKIYANLFPTLYFKDYNLWGDVSVFVNTN